MSGLRQRRLVRAWSRTRRLTPSSVDLIRLWWCILRGLLEQRFPRLRSDAVRRISIVDNGNPRDVFVRANGMDIMTFWEVLVAQVYAVALPLPAEATIIDVGANIGFTTIFFADRTEQPRIVAVEPEPDNFSLLRRNAAGTTATLVEAAISSEGGRRLLRVGGPTAHRLAADDSAAGGGVEIETVALDDLATTEGLDHVDLLKIDIEGAEWAVIERGADILTRTERVVMEIHDSDDRARIAEALDQYGFVHQPPAAVGMPDLFIRGRR